jgi:hypothetical protein
MSNNSIQSRSSDNYSTQEPREVSRGDLSSSSSSSSTPSASETSSNTAGPESTSSSVTRRRTLNKDMDSSSLRERSDSVTYVPLETRRHSESPAFDSDESPLPPVRNLTNKVYEMNIMNGGEKSHLLVDETLQPTDDLCLAETKSFGSDPEESFWTITVQVFIPFLIAGMGMVGAGLVLDVVQV